MVFPTRIYLTGFMGSGKSTVGPILAERLGYTFVDLDAAIEAAAGKPIRRIFAEQGEDEFRRLESLKLRSVSRAARVVIALGGGAVISEDNLYFVVTNGTLVFLSVQPSILVDRLRDVDGERPLLVGADGRALSDAELVQRVEAMIERRRPFYDRADIVIDASELGVEETVEAVVAGLEQRVEEERSRLERKHERS